MIKDNTIVHSIANIPVEQRTTDGYVNATQLLKAHKAKTGETRKFANWLETERAKTYIAYVATDVGLEASSLIESRKGGRGGGGGSWLHPDLAVPFATWLSVDFELRVSRWVQSWMKTGENPVKQFNKSEYLAYLLPAEPLDWKCRYTPDFWQHLQRMYGYRQGNPACALWINRFVYGYFPQEVRDRLDEINPLFDGERPRKQHTHFDGTLLDSLEQHLMTVKLLMSVAASAKEFERLMDAKFRGLYQLQLWGGASNA